MRQMTLIIRFVLSLCVVSFGGLVAAYAQDTEINQLPGWQVTITNQIEAFRRGDAQAALSLAAMGFRARYSSPSRFYADIKMSGYGPIVDSRSHRFGDFEMMGDKFVTQVVLIQGPDQGLYRAVYRLAAEPEGWRVQGVLLRKRAGFGV